MLVYVLKQNGQPFMPTERFGKVRRLLKSKRAKVIKRCPFIIKLLFEPENDFVGECYCGVDTGSKHIGVAVVSNDRVLYQSQTELRSDIKKWTPEGCTDVIDVQEKLDTERKDS